MEVTSWNVVADRLPWCVYTIPKSIGKCRQATCSWSSIDHFIHTRKMITLQMMMTKTKTMTTMTTTTNNQLIDLTTSYSPIANQYQYNVGSIIPVPSIYLSLSHSLALSHILNLVLFVALNNSTLMWRLNGANPRQHQCWRRHIFVLLTIITTSTGNRFNECSP